MWDGLFEPLAERRRTVGIDLRGYGRSALPGGPFSYVEDVRAVVDHLDLAPAALVGASFGGRIALDVALTYPDRVSAFVLLAPALSGWAESDELELLDAEENRLLDAGDLDGAVELNVRTWVDGPGRGPDAVDPAVRARVGEMQRQAFETILAAYQREPPPGPVASLEPPAADRLAEIRVPTLVVVGDRDFPDFRTIADRLAAEIPGARQAVLEDAAHMLALERPAEVRQLIDEFLSI
jgi:3-oxoadipate enol-lactonase